MMRPDFSQIARFDWPIAPRIDGLWAGRSAIHHDEFHMQPPNAKQNTVSAGWGPSGGAAQGLLTFGENAAGVSPRSLSSGVKPTQPSAVAILACLEAVSAFRRTEGGSPAVVSYEAELSAADRATVGRAVPGMLGSVSHGCLLLTLRGWWLVLVPRSPSHFAHT
jgi:hypothetical protein